MPHLSSALPEVSVRDQVLISYVPKDRRWAKLLRTHLRPLEMRGQLRCWEHADILPGSVTTDTQRRAVDRTKVAVLLLSADYLAGEDPTRGELATLLSLASSGAITILTVYARACSELAELSRYAAVNSPNKPLARLTVDERDQFFISLLTRIDELLKPVQIAPAVSCQIPLQAVDEKTGAASLEEVPVVPSEPKLLIRQLRVRSWVQNLPRGLAQELAEFYDEISEVKRIVREARALMHEHAPDDMALPLSHVPLGGGARVAWEAAILESAKVSPRSLMSLLLSARDSTRTQLPITEQTIHFLYKLPA